MSRTVEHYDAILNDHILTNIVMLVLLVLAAIGTVLFFIFFVRRKKTEWDGEEGYDGDDILTVVLMVAVVVICFIAGKGCVVDIIDCRTDIAEQSYVIVDKTFLLTSEKIGIRPWRSENRYSIVYEENGDAVELAIDTQYCDWDEGRYTDCVFVYSARSKILLDVWEK